MCHLSHFLQSDKQDRPTEEKEEKPQAKGSSPAAGRGGPRVRNTSGMPTLLRKKSERHAANINKRGLVSGGVRVLPHCAIAPSWRGVSAKHLHPWQPAHALNALGLCLPGAPAAIAESEKGGACHLPVDCGCVHFHRSRVSNLPDHPELHGQVAVQRQQRQLSRTRWSASAAECFSDDRSDGLNGRRALCYPHQQNDTGKVISLRTEPASRPTHRVPVVWLGQMAWALRAWPAQPSAISTGPCGVSYWPGRTLNATPYYATGCR
jgi:hypothetical protein